jgi:flavodoxin
MKKVIVIFGSLLGKTKRISVLVGHTLKQGGFDVKVKDVRDVAMTELGNYDLVVLGCSTWYDGMLQFDFRPFHKEMMKTDYAGQNFAVFGVGGHKYPHFCLVADILEKTALFAKASILVPTLRLDIDHDEPADKLDKEILDWCNKITSALQ